MTTLRIYILLLCFALISNVHADERPPAATTARTIALGGSVTALGDDAATSLWNPSGVPLLQRQELAFSYADRYGLGIKTNYASYIFPLFERHAIGIDYLRESFGDNELEDQFQIINATYGIRLHRSFSLGVSGKMVNQSIELDGTKLRSASGFGFDLGLLYAPKVAPFDKLKLGLTLNDVSGTKVRDDNSQAEEKIFKQSLRFGAAYQAHKNVQVSLDVDDRIAFGAEYQPTSSLILRGGLNHDYSAPAGADNTLAFALGFGLKWRNTKLDYAYEYHPVLPATHHLSFAMSYNPSLVTIKDALVRHAPVFKSLYKTYEGSDFVDVVIKNSSSDPLPVTVSIDIPTLTKTPHEETVTLPPNSTEQYGFALTFPQDILSTQSSYYDNLVQPTIKVTYAQGRSPKSTSKRIPSVYVLGKGKLSWANSKRIAAFVTPQSSTVNTFARQGVLAQYADLLQRKFPKNNIGKAAVIFDALSTYGLRYQQDQTTPFLQIFEDDSVFDTVQYPYEFLQSKIGDCDDCTVIYCSMLENLGIPTAALDVNDPEYGHIFMMFDSGIPINDAGDFFTNEKEYVIWEGSIWIPVETTLFGQSFSDAWRNGAKEYYVRKERGYIKEIRISDAQQTFQPGVVPDADIAIPSKEKIDELFKRDVAFFDNRLDQIALSSGVSLDSAEGLYDTGATYLRLNQLDRAIEMFDRAIALDPTFADAYNAKGVVLIKQRQYDDALQLINKALDINPNDAGYRINISIVYHLKGNKEQAQQVYDQAVAQDRNFAGVIDFSGRASEAVREAAPAVDPIQRAAAEKAYDDGAALLRLDRIERAQETFERALSLDPNNADAYNAKGVIATKAKNYDEALGLYQKAVGIDPDNAGYHINMAITYHVMGKKPEAIRAYTRAVQLDPEYRGTLDMITGGEPLPDLGPAPAATASVDPIKKLTAQKAYDDGAAFLRLDATDKALNAFDRSLSFDPTNADALNGKGVIATRARNYQEALDLYAKAIAADPNNAGFHINQAITYHLSGQKANAQSAYDKAISLDASVKGQLDDYLNEKVAPSTPSVPTETKIRESERIYDNGAAFLRLDRFDRATETFDSALSLNPQNADALNGKGVIATKERNYQEAIGLYNKAIAIDPNNAGYHINLAITYHVFGDAANAQRAYDKAVSLDASMRGLLDSYLQQGSTKPAIPSSGSITVSPLQRMAAEELYNTGAAILNQGRLERARETFDRSLGQNPQNADALNGKGVVATKERNYQEAIDLYNKAIAIEPNNAGYHINLAIAYHLLGQQAQAKAAYQKAIELDSVYRNYLDVLEE